MKEGRPSRRLELYSVHSHTPEDVPGLPLHFRLQLSPPLLRDTQVYNEIIVFE